MKQKKKVEGAGNERQIGGKRRAQQGLQQAVAEETRNHAVDPPPTSPPAL